MDIFYRLLARCQQAVWNVDEFVTAFRNKDWEALGGMDFRQLRSDMKWVWFVALSGYGPLLR